MKKIISFIIIIVVICNVSFASSIVYSDNVGPGDTIVSSIESTDRPLSKGKLELKDLYIPKAMNEVNGVGAIATFYSLRKGKEYKLVDVYSYYEYEPTSWNVNNFSLEKIDASLHGRYTRYNRYNSAMETSGTYFIDLMDETGNIETLWLQRMIRTNTEVNCVHPIRLFDEQFNEILLFDYMTLKEKGNNLSDYYKTKSQAYKYWLEQGHADKSWIKVYCDPIDWD